MLLVSVLLCAVSQLPSDWRLIDLAGVERLCDLSGVEGFTAQTRSGEAVMVATDGTIIQRDRVPESRQLRGGLKDYGFLWDLTRHHGDGAGQWQNFELMNLFGAAVFLGRGSSATILTRNGLLPVPGQVNHYSGIGLNADHRKSVALSVPTNFLLVWESTASGESEGVWLPARTPVTAIGRINSNRDAFVPLMIPGYNDVRLLQHGLVAFLGRLATVPNQSATAVHERLANLPLIKVLPVEGDISFGYVFVMDVESGITIAVARTNVEVVEHLVLPRVGTLSSDASGSTLFVRHAGGVVAMPTNDLKRRFDQGNR